MSSTELLCHLIGISPTRFSREEIFIIEAELFTRLCDELKALFKTQYKHYFKAIKLHTEMEDSMIEIHFMRCVINDILSTDEYTLPGIAYYTQTPEEVVYDVVTGRNTNPSSSFFRKIIELHRSVRRDLYVEIMKKVVAEGAMLA